MNFGIIKFDKKELARKVITTASSSWHFADLAHRDKHYESCAKNIFHALRILDFGIQIKDFRDINDYSSMNEIRKMIYSVPPDPKDYYKMFLILSDLIKK